MKLKKSVYDEIVKHAKEAFPVEACGYFAGKDGEITEVFRMKNVDNSSEHFSFDPEEQFKIYKKVRNMGLKILGVYHSHPYTPARMSEEDIKLAYDETISYAIVSLANKEPVMKIFKVINGKPDEIEYEILK